MSKAVFSAVDDHLWKLTYRWALRAHPNKSKAWVIARYFDRFNASRADRWVFGDRHSGAYLFRLVWTKIVRHQMIVGTSSPDDPALAHYWDKRRSKQTPLPLDRPTLDLLMAQDGRCPACGDHLLPAEPPRNPDEWERWLRTTRKTIKKHGNGSREAHSTPDGDQLRLVHAHCQRRHTFRTRPEPTTASTPTGLA